MNYTIGVQNFAPLMDLQIETGPAGGDTESSVSVPKTPRKRASVVAQLLRVGREVVAVVPSDVGVDAAALAPPLVAVGSQAGETDGGDICPYLPNRWLPAVTAGRGKVGGGVYLAWMF